MKTIEIDGVEFTPLPGVRYLHDYVAVVESIECGECEALDVFRELIKSDLWFLIYFVMRNSSANHPFVVDCCREVQGYLDGGTFDRRIFLWAREHFKSTIISTAAVIQKLLRNPEERIGIFSYAKKPAEKLLRPIKALFEGSELLKDCFEDVIWREPFRDSPKWSDQEGLILRRKGFYKEASVEAHGLVEGMPTGSHFTGMVFDDIETEDLVFGPEIMDKVKRSYDMAQFLGSEGGWHVVVGTTYHWSGPLQYIRGKSYESGERVYRVSLRPGCEGGLANGKPVLLSQEKIDFWKTNKRSFYSQCLLDPTPQTERPLDPGYLRMVRRREIPARLYRFMMVDPAGNSAVRSSGKAADAWGMAVVGVEPYLDNLGLSKIYILDLVIKPMNEAEAMSAVVDMYCRNGRITKLGVEKVAMTTAETHIANALRMKGRYVSVENGGIQVLKPGGRKKQERIEKALQWPLENGKVHVVDDVDEESLARLRTEMEKFPYWNDDGLDAVSYVYDLLDVHTLGAYPGEKRESKKETDAYDEAFERTPKWRGKNGWLEA